VSLAAFRYHSTFLTALRDRGVLDGLSFSLIDVGCSGGINSFWDQFGKNFRAVGFDPLVSEVERLNEEAAGRDVSYVAAWVGAGNRPLPTGVVIDPEPRRGPYSAFSLSSASRAFEATKLSITADVFNRGAELRFAEQRLSVDEWLAKNGFGRVDVLKCDVDGFDFEVFVGAHNLLSGPERPLALITEAQLHEPQDRHGTAFGDLDRYLRDHGYRLFDIDIHRYSRAELPAPFASTLFAQTLTGQALHCDALYMLDPVMDPGVLDDILLRGDESALLKLIVLYEAFGLPDCAAALLVQMRERGVAPCGIDFDWALDQLVPANPYGAASHKAYLEAFNANPKMLFPMAAGLAEELHPQQRMPAEIVAAEAPEHSDSAPATVLDWTQYMMVGDGCLKEGSAILSPTGHRGHMCYGPYIHLPTGGYRGTIILDLPLNGSLPQGGNVTLEAVCNEVVLAQSILEDIRSGAYVIDVDFSIPAGIGPFHTQLRLSVEASSEQRIRRVMVEEVG
jgi:FkbM family methyltransferase